MPRLLGWALFLLIVADANVAVWPVALLALPLALLVSMRLAGPARSPGPIRLRAVLRFVPFFLAESVRGGVDVARRALAPRPRLDPVLIRYRTQLRGGSARVAFVDVVSLLPGTLCADVSGDELIVHSLDERAGDRSLRGLERHMAAIFPSEPVR